MGNGKGGIGEAERGCGDWRIVETSEGGERGRDAEIS